MKRSTFIAAGGAATLAGCAHGQVLPTAGAPVSPSSAVKSAAALDAAKKDDPAVALPPNPILGEMRRFDGKTPPPGWTFCNGATLTIASNKNLFAILGKSAGGDGKKTFALPKSGLLPHVICTEGEFITRPKALLSAFAQRKSPNAPHVIAHG